jgi:hypothetical protein
MGYERSFGYISRKMFIFADFHVLGLFTHKKQDFSENKIRLSLLQKFVSTLASPYKSLRAEILAPIVFWANLM